MYKNPLPGGVNVIKLGDGAAYIRTGGKMIFQGNRIKTRNSLNYFGI